MKLLTAAISISLTWSRTSCKGNKPLQLKDFEIYAYGIRNDISGILEICDTLLILVISVFDIFVLLIIIPL